MSIEGDTADATPDDVEAIAADLGAAIADTPEYERFADAKAAVEADEDAQEAIQEFEQIREEFMRDRQAGRAGPEDLQALQAAQEDLHDIPVMAEFLEAKAELEGRLEAVDDAISEPLVVDFGETAGGCCED